MSKMDISENRRPQMGGLAENMRLVNTQNWEWTCESVPFLRERGKL